MIYSNKFLMVASGKWQWGLFCTFVEEKRKKTLSHKQQKSASPFYINQQVTTCFLIPIKSFSSRLPHSFLVSSINSPLHFLVLFVFSSLIFLLSEKETIAFMTSSISGEKREDRERAVLPPKRGIIKRQIFRSLFASIVGLPRCICGCISRLINVK